MSGPAPVGGAGQGGGVRQIMDMRQQIIERSRLLKDLHEARAVDPSGQASPAQATGPAPGFADTLKSALDEVSAVQGRSEDISSAYQRGEVTDVAKVMLARQEAGVAFEATLQVRNRLLSAYQDIMRMGV